MFEDNFDYEQCNKRKRFIEWLGENQIKFEECFGFAPGAMFIPYLGQIDLDVPYEESTVQYQLLSRYLENPDSSPKDPDVISRNFSMTKRAAH